MTAPLPPPAPDALLLLARALAAATGRAATEPVVLAAAAGVFLVAEALVDTASHGYGTVEVEFAAGRPVEGQGLKTYRPKPG